jgi:hypothetical protein
MPRALEMQSWRSSAPYSPALPPFPSTRPRNARGSRLPAPERGCSQVMAMRMQCRGFTGAAGRRDAPSAPPRRVLARASPKAAAEAREKLLDNYWEVRSRAVGEAGTGGGGRGRGGRGAPRCALRCAPAAAAAAQAHPRTPFAPCPPDPQLPPPPPTRRQARGVFDPQRRQQLVSVAQQLVAAGGGGGGVAGGVEGGAGGGPLGAGAPLPGVPTTWDIYSASPEVRRRDSGGWGAGRRRQWRRRGGGGAGEGRRGVLPCLAPHLQMLTRARLPPAPPHTFRSTRCRAAS